MLDLVACDPNVAVVNIFHLVDETNLSGWQSGLYFADQTPEAVGAGRPRLDREDGRALPGQAGRRGRSRRSRRRRPPPCKTAEAAKPKVKPAKVKPAKVEAREGEAGEGLSA